VWFYPRHVAQGDQKEQQDNGQQQQGSWKINMTLSIPPENNHAPHHHCSKTFHSFFFSNSIKQKITYFSNAENDKKEIRRRMIQF
jgi:hypothetical protein